MTATRPRWGKAGQRLTPQEATQRDQAGAVSRGRALASRQANLERARRYWREGLISPARITIALDAHNLYGPEVDAACGVEEPAVDLWERGRLYPTWEQFLALAELCRVQPMFFVNVGPTVRPQDTSMRYHMRRDELAALAVYVAEFPRDVVAATVGDR